MPAGLVLRGMNASEHSRYYWNTDLDASFIGVTSVAQFDQICTDKFSPFYIEGVTSRVVAAKYFAATGPALVHKYTTAYPSFSFPKEYPVPTRAVISIYNPAMPQDASAHISVRLGTTNTYVLRWLKAGGTAGGYRYVWANTPTAYKQVSLGTLAAAHTTTTTIYFAPVLAALGITEENRGDIPFVILNLYNYPAGTGYAAGNYPAAYYCRLNSLSFHWN